MHLQYSFLALISIICGASASFFGEVYHQLPFCLSFDLSNPFGRSPFSQQTLENATAQARTTPAKLELPTSVVIHDSVRNAYHDASLS